MSLPALQLGAGRQLRGNPMGRVADSLRPTLAYNADAKKEFKLAALNALRKLSVNMRLERGTYEIRWNEGGIAVSGEATLHHDRFYLQVEQSSLTREGGVDMSVMYRTCRNRNDYSGGDNHFASAVHLDDTIRMAQLIELMLGGPVVPRLDGTDRKQIVDRGNGPGED